MTGYRAVLATAIVTVFACLTGRVPIELRAATECGLPLSTYRGITAFSNGARQGTNDSCVQTRGPFGWQYQCVELIKRFYALAIGTDTSGWWGNAVDYFDTAAEKGLVAYANDGPTSPAPDDILVFANDGGFGHVSIVTGVSADTVTLVEQNWSPTGVASLPLLRRDGHYTIPDRGTRTTYRVLGWLRYPSNPGAPIARDDFYTMTKGGRLTVPAPGILGNDTVAPSSNPQVEFMPPFPPASMTNTNDGGFVLDFAPNPSFVGTITISYVVHTALGDSNFAVVTVRVDPVPLTSRVTLQISTGNNQTGLAGTILPNAISVLSVDEAGNPVGLVPVTFRVTSGGGCVSASPDGTNCQSELSRVTNAVSGPLPGLAGVFWTLGPLVGTQTVEVVSPGVSTITLTATSLSAIISAQFVADTWSPPNRVRAMCESVLRSLVDAKFLGRVEDDLYARL